MENVSFELHLPSITNYFNPLTYITGISATLLIVYIASSLDIKKKIQGFPALYRWYEKQSRRQEKGDISSKTYSINWWKDPKVFELERRAIFSKEWSFVTHTSRFTKAGDYRTFEIAGFSFIVILGKDKKIRAFHNVCRHRAYAVTKKEVGSSAVLGCRYHGWSYDTRGKLIKAPEFDTVGGFEKEANSLWEVKTKVRNSMVFINFDNGSEVASLDLNGTDRLLKKWGIAKMSSVSDWKVDGSFNWKLSDSLYSSPVMHSRPWWYGGMPAWLWNRRRDTKVLRTTIVRQHRSGMILLVKSVPKSSTLTTLECSVFMSVSKKTGSAVEDVRKELALEVDALVLRQRQLVHDLGPLPESLATKQEEIGRILKDHADAENKAGLEIHPAARSQSFTLGGKADDDFCRELEEGRSSVCSSNAKGLLDW